MQKFFRFAVVSIGLLISCLFALAQDRSISGTVTGVDGAPLPGVTVAIVGTNSATVTDLNGKFSLTARRGQTLRLSYVGYTMQEIVVGESDNISVRMGQSSGTTLEDVVVVGYGTQRRGNVTGAVSTVNVGQTLDSRPITDVTRALQGAVPGLTITTPSGDIGTNPSIRLRGMSGSLNGPGAQPLILVD